MNVVDQINRWLLSRRGNKRTAATINLGPAGLTVHSNDRETSIPWDEITRVVVLTVDAYVPTDFWLMVIQWGDGEILEINEEMPVWSSLVTTLERFLPGSTASHKWMLEIQANPKTPVTIYRRATTTSPAS